MAPRLSVQIPVWAAVLAGKLLRLALGCIGSAATNAPGMLSARLRSDLLARLLSDLPEPPLLVTGTNGKTTSAGILASIIKAHGGQLIHNSSGANMTSGILSELLKYANLDGTVMPRYRHHQPLFEADEAYIHRLTAIRSPGLILVNNFFRDQLDRFGELRHTVDLVQKSINQLNIPDEHPNCTLVLNADDPNASSLHGHDNVRCVYYGFGAECQLDREVYASELGVCPLCNSDLVYAHQWLGQCGDYSCPACSYTKPTQNIQVTQLDMRVDSTAMTVCCMDREPLRIETDLPGLFNAYNVLAAVSAAITIGIDNASICAGVRQFVPSFGRSQRLVYRGHECNVFLIKNPIGASEVLRLLRLDRSAQILIIINDNYADGRDVSWLWDAYFEHLAGHEGRIYLSGTRANEMALRLEHLDVPVQIYSQTRTALEAMSHENHNEKIYILPTYTALLELTRIIPTMNIT